MARYTGPSNKLFRNKKVKDLSNGKLTSSMSISYEIEFVKPIIKKFGDIRKEILFLRMELNIW